MKVDYNRGGFPVYLLDFTHSISENNFDWNFLCSNKSRWVKSILLTIRALTLLDVFIIIIL
jgi:hypothetical protein